MAVIIEGRRRHYIGTDADKASIPAGAKSLGDSYHANDKGKQYYWDGANWKTGLGYEYVPRLLTATDFGAADFTKDGATHVDGLDVSAIVPVGAVAVVFDLLIRATAANGLARITRDAVNTHSRIEVYSQVANQNTTTVQHIVPCDSNRLFDYYFANTVNVVELSVAGWCI